MEPADWDQAVMHLSVAAQDFQVLGRLLDQSERLTTWQAGRELLAGTLAADALDQALGLLEELAGGEAAVLVATVKGLLSDLPPVVE